MIIVPAAPLSRSQIATLCDEACEMIDGDYTTIARFVAEATNLSIRDVLNAWEEKE